MSRGLSAAWAALGVLLTLPAYPQVTVDVRADYSAVHFSRSLGLGPREAELVTLQLNAFKDHYSATVEVRGGEARVFLLDNRDVKERAPTPRLLRDFSVSGRRELSFPAPPTSAGATLVVRNESSLSHLEVQIIVYRIGLRSKDAIAQMRQWVELPVNALSMDYMLPRFKVTIQPCGLTNAYSTPDIVVCTELLNDLNEQHLNWALQPILLHELAHSLLYCWGLPGYDNEDLADEFAAMFLAQTCDRCVDDVVTWLEKQDPVREAILQLTNGDRHALSIQRARNMKAALPRAQDLQRRWATLLSPFRRQKAANPQESPVR